jgi:hypothetical protein
VRNFDGPFEAKGLFPELDAGSDVIEHINRGGLENLHWAISSSQATV